MIGTGNVGISASISKALGESTLRCLALTDIVRLQNSATFKSDSFLFSAMTCKLVAMTCINLKTMSIKWFNQRRCCVQFVSINIELLS